MNQSGLLRVASVQLSKRVAVCKVCRKAPVYKFGAKVCGSECAQTYIEQMNTKAERAKAKAQKSADKAALEQYKPLKYWESIAERHCNAYIRARDPNVCISCGVTHASAWQAGHYISVGANKTLRYTEDNIHKQCIHCNMHLASNAIEYRRGLIEKIGVERVEALEAWHPAMKLTKEYLQEVAEYFKKKLKELKTVKP